MSKKRTLDASDAEVSDPKRAATPLHQFIAPGGFLQEALCADVRNMIADLLEHDPDYLYVKRCDTSWCNEHNMCKTSCCLAHVKAQPQWVCLIAVQRDGWALRLVKEQTEALCLAAVQQNGWALRYVKKQTEVICLAAVQQDGLALQHVKDQTEAICLAAVQQYG